MKPYETIQELFDTTKLNVLDMLRNATSDSLGGAPEMLNQHYIKTVMPSLIESAIANENDIPKCIGKIQSILEERTKSSECTENEKELLGVCLKQIRTFNIERAKIAVLSLRNLVEEEPSRANRMINS